MKNLVGFNELSEYDGLGTAFGDTGKNQGRVMAIEEGRIACVSATCRSLYIGIRKQRRSGMYLSFKVDRSDLV